MRDIYYFLENYKPKHNLNFDLYLQDVDNDGDLSVHFTIFNNKNWNNFITIYSFDAKKVKQKKIDKIRKLLSNKRKALLFIGNKSDIE